jgi:hypothetical protein
MGYYKKPVSRLTNRTVARPVHGNFKKDESMFNWLREQTWSEFAVSLADYYQKFGGFSEKQLSSAKSMRMKLDEFYDPYGKTIENGVYMDTENEEIYKLAWTVKNEFKSRSLRKREIDSANWRNVPEGIRYIFFDGVTDGKIVELSEEQIVQIGKDTGICCVCGKVLDNPASIAAGIGPYCAKQQRMKDEVDNGRE